MKKEVRISAVDYDLLADSYRPRVLLIFSAILSPVTYAITIGIYMLLRKPLNSYLMPKVKEISTNEKELLFRRKPTTSQVIGGAISATTALFAASYFASAVNVLVTPRENQNGFNKANDAIGRIYSFGLAGNTEDIKAMSQFLRQVDGDFVTDVQNLVEYNPSTQTFDKTDAANNAVAAQIAKYAFLFESPEAAKVIFDSLVSKISIAYINVLNLAFDEVQDKDHNIAESAQQARKMENLINFVSSHNILNSRLPLVARQALFERLVKAIDSFEHSSYMDQYRNAVSENEGAKLTVTSRNESLTNNRNELTAALSDQTKLVTMIEATAGFKSFSSDAAHPDNVFSFNETSVDRTTAVAGSEIARNTITETSDKAAMEAQQIKYNTAKTAYGTYHNGTFAAEEQTKTAKETANKTKKDEVDAKTTELRNANSDLTTKTSNLTDKQKDLDDLDKRIAELPGLITKAEDAAKTASANLVTASALVRTRTNELSDAQAALSKVQGELATLESALTAANANVTSAQTAYNQAKAAYDANPKDQALATALQTAQANLNAANTAATNAKTNRDNKSREVSTANSKVATAQTNLTNAQSAESLARDESTNKATTVSQLNAELNLKRNSRQSYVSARDLAQSEKTAAEATVKRVTDELDIITKAYNAQVTAYNSYLTATYNPIANEDKRLNGVMVAESNSLTSLTNTYDKQKQKVDEMITKVNDALTNNQTGLPGVHNRITTANKNIDTLNADAPHIFDSTLDHAD